jgi:hypothetical protein
VKSPLFVHHHLEVSSAVEIIDGIDNSKFDKTATRGVFAKKLLMQKIQQDKMV